MQLRIMHERRAAGRVAALTNSDAVVRGLCPFLQLAMHTLHYAPPPCSADGSLGLRRRVFIYIEVPIAPKKMTSGTSKV